MGILSSLNFLRKKRADRRYAVEVNTDSADSMAIPDAKIVGSWENSENTTVFVVESEKDLRAVVGGIPGVRDIRKM